MTPVCPPNTRRRAPPTAVLVALVALAAAATAAACRKRSEEPGPVYSPVVANQLRALASDCTFQRPGSGGAHETRVCHGRQATMTITLGAERRLRSLEIMVLASSAPEAVAMLQPVIEQLIAQPVIDALEPRFRVQGSSAEAVVAGQRLRTETDTQRYRVTFLW